MPAITALPFFVYPVTEMARAKAFYGNVLGLTEIANWEDQWVEFGIGPDDAGPALAVSTMMSDDKPIAAGGAVALETPDFDEMVARLKDHGVTFALEPMETSVCHFARFQDPDGNNVILHRKHE